MNDCRELELLLASDEPGDLARAKRHVLACGDCRELYDAQVRLARRVEAWDPAVEPSVALEHRVRAAVRRQLAHERRPSRGRSWLYVAAALLLALLGTWLGQLPSAGPSEAHGLLVADALSAAERAERQHARAIASLENAVEVRLARAEDPAVPAAEAALLLSYRDRIASLESTIAEVQEYLRDNPAHPGARTVLLAAYRDKTDVLREVLALGDPT